MSKIQTIVNKTIKFSLKFSIFNNYLNPVNLVDQFKYKVQSYVRVCFLC